MRIKAMRRWLLFQIPISVLLLALGFGGGLYWASRPTPSPTPTRTITPSATTTPSRTPSATPSPTDTATSTPSRTPTITLSPTITLTPTITPTPSDTPTPTATPVIWGRVSVQANCRYGPGSAYLYEWGLYPGNRVDIVGRNQEGTWVFVDPWTYVDFCWVKTELLEVTGNVADVPQVQTLLPWTRYYWPPRAVQAKREGDEVWVDWAMVPMSEDDNRGYLIEAWLCQDGQVRFTPLHFWQPPAILIDEPGCLEPSSGRIYTAEKHGYTKWVRIPWPTHEPTPTPSPSPSATSTPGSTPQATP